MQYLKGCLALCSRGYLGLITEDRPKKVKYDDGTEGEAYVGIHLMEHMVGKPWSSRNPRKKRLSIRNTRSFLFNFILRKISILTA